ncbi:hypothetical protein LTR08_002599 [Meristemomyces frigidus]|nr:hypothetical protein LTR08_002599 [Meristemomyces frigidus]
MPGWHFWRRRSSAVQPSPHTLSESAPPTHPASATSDLAGRPYAPLPRRSSQRKREAARQDMMAEARSVRSSKRYGSAGKENIAQRRGSIEDITALPVSRKLESSPHLRPVDLERPHIPYNFRQYATSQTSIQRPEVKPSRPQTLRSKRSAYSSGPPERRRSSKRPKDDSLREEEIRQMSTPVSTPKRPGDGPLRRASKKMRGAGMKGSTFSLPTEESIHSGMSALVEHRGWEIGSLDVFNPRPAVRLSGAPQYVAPSSIIDSSPLSRKGSTREKEKEKMPAASDKTRKRQTIGNRADEFDASDLRLLMERDANRREKRKKEQQEKLDRKLRSRNGRNRGDSDRRKREAEELRREEDARIHAEAVQRAREIVSTPTDAHPALRDDHLKSDSEVESVGLGIGAAGTATAAFAAPDPEQRPVHVLATTEEQGTGNTGTYLNYPQGANIPANPFEDPASSPATTEPKLERLPTLPGAFTPLETPVEDPMVHTANAVRLSQASTPPLSPVSPVRIGPNDRIPSGLSQSITSEFLARGFMSDLPSPPPIGASERRTSEPKERRTGAWASFFRRGGTTFKRPGEEGRSSPSDFSFSNTSRESMRNQPLPAHLVGIDTPPPTQRSKSTGAPVRAKSRFREDLPEMPISPPDSRMPSPDVTMATADAAAARRARRKSKPVDALGATAKNPEHDASVIGRNDTPVSPSVRSQRLMSASMASVDSEGSWLASSGQRQSMQSALSRSIGSLSKRRAEFNASYEELGGDRDAEYVQRATHGVAFHSQRAGSPAMAGAGPDEESEYGEDVPEETLPADPLTVHGSVRRKPTLVHRDLHVKSREGLLADYATGAEPTGTQDSPHSLDSMTGPDADQFDLDLEESTETQVQSARSVNYGKNHARQMSAGSAKLLDIPLSKRSMDAGSRDSSAGPPPSVRRSQP